MNKKRTKLWVVVIGALLLTTHLALAGQTHKSFKVQKDKKFTTSKQLKKHSNACDEETETKLVLGQYVGSSQTHFLFNKFYFFTTYHQVFFKTSIFFQTIYQTSVPVTTHILQIIKWLTLPNAP